MRDSAFDDFTAKTRKLKYGTIILTTWQGCTKKIFLKVTPLRGFPDGFTLWSRHEKFIIKTHLGSNIDTFDA